MDTTNFLGAAIFWLYIVAALTFTGIAIHTIIKLPASGSRHVATFATLALLSFMAISFNMLHILVQSYQLWTKQRDPMRLSVYTIWNWSITSTLFRDFGEAIVEDEPCYLWTQSALLVTLAVCLYMACEGTGHNIPRLWAFFALSQILPISFAQNLFYIALVRSGFERREVVLPQNITIRVIAAYCACLFVAPYSKKGPYLIPVILVARFMLFAPLRLAKVSHSDEVARMFKAKQAYRVLAPFSAALIARQTFALWKLWPVSIVGALFTHPAVTTLGIDFAFSILSFLIWKSIRGGEGSETTTKTL